jgi:hypothetical protein
VEPETQPALIAAVALGAFFGIARRAQVDGAVRGRRPRWHRHLRLRRLAHGPRRGFFVPGLLANAGYALAYTISIAVRWPLVGVLIAIASNRGMEWRQDPASVRAYSRASWVWVGLFSLRLAVQLPLYLTGAVVALGVTRVAMGVPLFVVGIWLSWLILRTRRPD